MLAWLLSYFSLVQVRAPTLLFARNLVALDHDKQHTQIIPACMHLLTSISSFISSSFAALSPSSPPPPTRPWGWPPPPLPPPLSSPRSARARSTCAPTREDQKRARRGVETQKRDGVVSYRETHRQTPTELPRTPWREGEGGKEATAVSRSRALVLK